MTQTPPSQPIPSQPHNPCDVTADMEQSRQNIIDQYGADAPNWFIDQMVLLERNSKHVKKQEREISRLLKLKTEDNE